LNVNKDKGYIDLSKLHVHTWEIEDCENRFNRAKTVHSILGQVSASSLIPIINLYETIAWPLAKKYNNAFDAFSKVLLEPQIIEELDIPKGAKEPLMAGIIHRLTPQPVKMRADFDMTCFNEKGVDAIIRSLRKGKALSTEIDIKLIAAPLYIVATRSLDKTIGLDLLKKCLDTIQEAILSEGGTMKVKIEPRIVNKIDDDKLTQFMKKISWKGEEKEDSDSDSNSDTD
jgi:translation initiation factor 2 subunit 1